MGFLFVFLFVGIFYPPLPIIIYPVFLDLCVKDRNRF